MITLALLAPLAILYAIVIILHVAGRTITRRRNAALIERRLRELLK